ncbi:SpoIIAA family protein [Leeuwenhoekiella palythoae]|uniref:SpoIIAA-like n=1 Tax=Leeuwenhoekiella palythoae TaxID=573501 RepID=A0A1M5ZCU9_9FLAO|nr:STAS/SEC14 domain-containing protein [Leeuwenhoekiella palythoae]RXG28033.1 SpoIIAA-like protein [Leeuwenhoekiella palythoae]SHI22012.1 SpoIIAA-like [Leeuwenhoekiella palythoae]
MLKPLSVLFDFSLSDNSIGYIVEGTMDYKAVQELKEAILDKFKKHDSINLYLEDNNIERFSLDAVFIAGIFPMQHKNQLNKVAMVTNRKWIHAIANFNKAVIGKDLRNFTIDRRMEAMNWIASQD